MIRSVADAIARFRMAEPGEKILAALSGGADSTALLLSLRELGYEVCAAHVHHGIRGEEAERDARFCEELCAREGVPFRLCRTDVPALCRERKTGVEETARAERYRLLEEAREAFGCAHVATAHNLEDNAETVLLHLTRGAGLSGLCGIPPVRGRIIRPLLFTSRRDVLSYLEARGQPFVTDSTNECTDLARNRIRRCVLPELEKINPGCAAALARTAELLSRDEAVLEAASALPELTCTALLSLPEPLALRAIRREYTAFTGDVLSMDGSERALALCKNKSPSASADLPGARLRRAYDRLFFEDPDAPAGFAPRRLCEGETVIEECGVRLIAETCDAPENVHNSLNSFWLSRATIGEDAAVRSRRTGDTFRKNENGKRKTLKKWFIDDKIPLYKRSLLPVIASGPNVLAVVGYGADADARARPGERALRIRVESL